MIPVAMSCICGHMPSAIRLRRRGIEALCHGLRCAVCMRLEWAVTRSACTVNWNTKIRAELEGFNACEFEGEIGDIGTTELVELGGTIEAVSSAAEDVEAVHDDDRDPTQELGTLLDYALDLVAFVNKLSERCANTEYGNAGECTACGGSGDGRAENRCRVCSGKGEV